MPIRALPLIVLVFSLGCVSHPSGPANRAYYRCVAELRQLDPPRDCTGDGLGPIMCRHTNTDKELKHRRICSAEYPDRR